MIRLIATITLIVGISGCATTQYGPGNPSPLRAAAMTSVDGTSSEMITRWGHPSRHIQGDPAIGVDHVLIWEKVNKVETNPPPKRSDYQRVRTNCDGSINSWGHVNATCNSRNVTNETNYNAAMAGHNLGVALAKLAEYECRITAYVDTETMLVKRIKTNQSDFRRCAKLFGVQTTQP